MDKRYFSKKLVEWYQRSKRDLPWRTTNDPYKIWLSEIILQQTRVAQGLPYFENFVKEFPTVSALAKASEEKVMRLWQGLGYYSRARNLHKCAKVIVNANDSSFPQTYEALQALPGVGAYTAAAIASFAFKEKVAVVDGNVFRVLSRIFGISTPINTPAGRKEFTALANSLIPDDAATFNQAIMEFGALYCVPKNPLCESCIFKHSCLAFQSSAQALLPVKVKQNASRKRYLNYIVFKKGKSLLMKRRSTKDIWFGLYDFPLIEREKPSRIKTLDFADQKIKIEGNSAVVESKVYKHVLTHQTLYCRFVIMPYSLVKKNAPGEGKFYSYQHISKLPKSILITRFLEDYSFSVK